MFFSFLVCESESVFFFFYPSCHFLFSNMLVKVVKSGLPDISPPVFLSLFVRFCVSSPDSNAFESRQEKQIDGGEGGGVPASQRKDIRT